MKRKTAASNARVGWKPGLSKGCFILLTLAMCEAGVESACLADDAPGDQIQESAAGRSRDLPQAKEAIAMISSDRPPSSFTRRRRIKNGDAKITGMAFGPASDTIVATDGENVTRMWNVDTGKKLIEINTNKKTPVKCAVVLRGNQYVVYGGEFVGTHVADARSMKIVYGLALRDYISQLAAPPESPWCYAFGDKGDVYRYSNETHKGNLMPSETKAAWDFASVSVTGRTLLTGRRSSRSVRFARWKDDGMIQHVVLKTTGEICGVATDDAFAVAGMHPSQIRIYRVESYQPSAGVPYLDLRCRSRRPEFIAVEQRRHIAVVADANGLVEYFWCRAPFFHTTLSIPERAVATAAIAPDGCKIAFGHSDGSISLWEIPSLPVNPHAQANHLFRRYLEQGQYGTLEAICEQLRREGTYFAWWGRDLSRYSAVIQMLGARSGYETDPERLALLQRWHDSKPNSHAAALALSRFYLNAAWEARGSGLAIQVTAAGREKFVENIDRAWRVVRPVAESTDVSDECFAQVFDIAKAQSWPKEEVDSYIDKMFQRLPKAAHPHCKVAELLMPRWGGEVGAPEQYAAKVAAAVGGDEGDELYARIGLRMAAYTRRQTFPASTGFDMDRINKGVAHGLTKKPTDLALAESAFRLLVIRRDLENARQFVPLLPLLENQWHLTMWGGEETWHSAAEWAKQQ